jgi:hypothetical protein
VGSSSASHWRAGLISRPALLLLDEPLANLDRELRSEMEVEIRRYQKELGIPFIYVTHNQEEALTMSDRIAVMRNGRFEQIGAKTEIYTNPASAFVATFVGHANRIEGRIAEVDGALRACRGAAARCWCRARRAPWSATRCVISSSTRTLEIVPATVNGVAANNEIRGLLRDIIFKGQTANYIVAVPNGGDLVVSDTPRTVGVHPNQPVIVRWPAGARRVLRGRGDMSGLGPLASFKRNPSLRFAALVGPGAAFIVISLLLPLLSIVVFSFWRTESYELHADWNLDNYRTLLGEAAYRIFFLRSLVTAVLVTLVCVVCGWPVAYFIARHGGRYRLLLVLALAAPFFTGAILRITALQGLLGPIGLINMALGMVGLGPGRGADVHPARLRPGAGLSLHSLHGDGDLPVAGQLQFRAARGREDQRRQALARVRRDHLAAELARHRHRHDPGLHPVPRQRADAALPGRAGRDLVRHEPGAAVR